MHLLAFTKNWPFEIMTIIGKIGRFAARSWTALVLWRFRKGWERSKTPEDWRTARRFRAVGGTAASWLHRILINLLFVGIAQPAFAANVIINEIMYHPSSGNPRESYIELYNTGTVAANLSGWRFTKGLQFTFPTNSSLAPGAYVVLAADRSAFTNKYPGVNNFVAGWSPPMGAHLRLEDSAGQVINELSYSNDGDW